MGNGNEKNVTKETRQKAEDYKRALRYIDGCADFTFEAFLETNRLAGNLMTESEVRRMYQDTAYILPVNGISGKEELKKIIRQTLAEGVQVFGDLAVELEKSDKKWWQFWK